MPVIKLDQLPLELTTAQAVENAYGEDIDWIAQRLRSRLSVLVECDKALTQYLYMAVRDRLRRDGPGGLSCVLIQGQPRRRARAQAERAAVPPGERAAPDPRATAAPDPRATVPPSQRGTPPSERGLAARGARDDGDGDGGLPGRDANDGYLRTFLNNLREVLEESIGRDDVVLVLPHLDLLTTTTKSGLTDLAKETLAWVHENPEALLLGFKDPAFEVPKPVEDLFTVKYPIIGLRRESIPKLLLRREARKFTADELNPYRFYKYVSGLTAVKFRRLMQHFDRAPDYDPARPETAERLFRVLREMTLVADFEVPQIDLHTDVGGYQTIKSILEDDILSLLRRRDQLTDERDVREIEEVVPKGLIFHGPPGTGKTFFAKAMATALDATIIIVSGPELKERWVGASEENLRRIFTQARKSAPSIIVFDELDSIASQRGMYYGSGVEHSMVNQLLTEMDGFRANELVFVVGTTNFLSSLDPALLRPGRFEMQIEIPFPNEEDRREILRIYRDKFELDLPDEVLEYLVERTEEFVDWQSQMRYTGDHLYAACRALRRRELREGRRTVTRHDVDEVLAQRRHEKMVVTEAELRTIAYHEAGHAIAAQMLPHAENVRKVSVVPGEYNLPALGVTLQQARENKYVITREELIDQIAVTLGGRIAEELVTGTVSNGAMNDLAQVSTVARAMVEELGMGETVGNQALRIQGPHGSERRPVGERLAAAIDTDVEALIRRAEERTRAVLGEHRALLDHLVTLLLEHKSLEGEALERAWSLPGAV